jgi:hypothetical protein
VCDTSHINFLPTAKFRPVFGDFLSAARFFKPFSPPLKERASRSLSREKNHLFRAQIRAEQGVGQNQRAAVDIHITLGGADDGESIGADLGIRIERREAQPLATVAKCRAAIGGL